MESLGGDARLPELGVLFVHGIGQQIEGQTLVKFADPITRWLARWLTRGNHTEAAVGHSDDSRVLLTDAVLASDPPAPAHLYVTIDGRDDLPDARGQRWLLAESYWAETFQPPKTSSLLLWMLLILPYMMLAQCYELFRRALRKPDQDGVVGELARVGRVLAFLVLYVSALPLAAVMAAVTGVLMVALFVPIPQVSAYAKKAALLLSNTLGDSFVLTSSAVQFDAMVARVVDDLRWLSTSATNVALVSHSQGAAVSYAAVSGYANPENLQAFVTVGEGIKKLNLVRGLQSYGEPRSAVDLSSLRSRRSRWAQSLAKAVKRWFKLKSLRFTFGWVGLVGFYLISYAIPQLLVVAHHQPTHLTEAWTLVGVGGVLVLSVCAVCHFFWQDDFAREPEPIPHGGGTLHWADFYASADPVANGPLFDLSRDPEEKKTWLVEKEVWNFASLLRDHTSYATSEDDFLGCLIGELFQAAGTPLPQPDVVLLERARWRGWWRVWWLTAARVLAVVAALVTIFRVWGHLEPIGERIIGWSHHTGPVRLVGKAVVAAIAKFVIVGHVSNVQIVGGLTIFLVVATGYAAVAAAWAYWQKQDVRRFYRRVSPDRDTDPLGGREFLLFLLVLCLLSFVAVVVGITRDYSLPWTWVRYLGWYLLLAASGFYLLPIVSAWMLRNRLRGLESRLMRTLDRDRRSQTPISTQAAMPVGN
jgi:hypothetical protein